MVLFTEVKVEVVYTFYGNPNTFECEFEYDYKYAAIFMDIVWGVLRDETEQSCNRLLDETDWDILNR